MKNKKGLWLVLLTALLLAVFSFAVSAEDVTIVASGNCGTSGSVVTWTLDSNGKLIISGQGAMRNYARETKAPWANNNVPVKEAIIENGITSIGNYGFQNCYGLKNISLADTITKFGDYAFESCINLEKLQIPASLNKIGSAAFNLCEKLRTFYIKDLSAWFRINGLYNLWNYVHCDKLYYNDELLTNLIIPDDVTEINDYAFFNCSGIKSITFSNSIISIGKYAFVDCNIERLDFPNGIKSIGEYAFCYCDLIKGIRIPSSLIYIGDNAFFYCLSLDRFAVDEDNQFFSSDDTGCLFSKDKSTLIQYPLGNERTSFSIPIEVKRIKEYSFDRSTIISLFISNNVETIDSFAFSRCRSLESITIDGYVKKIGLDAFLDTPYSDNDSNWENGVMYIGDNLISARETVPDNYVLKENTKSIAESAFSSCAHIKTVELPSGLISIGDWAFGNCGELMSISIPDTVQYIGESAFAYCSKLVEISIPASVVEMDSSPFHSCGNLLNITVSNSNPKYCDVNGALYNKEKTVLICYPSAKSTLSFSNEITEVGSFAFAGCNKIKTLWIPQTVKNIGSFAILANESLLRLIIPQSVKLVYEYGIMASGIPIYYTGTEEEWSSIQYTNGVESISLSDFLEPFQYEMHYNWSHNIDNPVTEDLIEPTCTSSGSYNMVLYCTDCGKRLFSDRVTLNALGHDYGDWVTAKEPTCTAQGQSRRNCSRCTEYETKAIAALGHNYTSTYTGATCTEKGYYTYTCSRCSNSYIEYYGSPFGHRFGTWNVIIEPTCTTKGTERRDCSRCDVSETRNINATGHHYDSFVTPPTCTEKGYTTYTCKQGDDSYKADYTNALGHDYGEWYTTVEPSCTVNGTARCDCSRCDAFDTKPIAATGHNYNAVVTAPTCTEQGYTTYTCKHGDDTYIADYVPANGHTEVVDEAIAATCTESGLTEGLHCSVCSDILVEQQIVPAHGHDFALSEIIDAKCSEDGQKIYVCKYDASHTRTETIPATGNHTDTNNDGKCDTCNQQMTGGQHCKYCGKIHGGAFGWLTKIFHSILAVFKR